MISERIKNLALSPTMQIAAKALMLKRDNIDIIDLSVGEPDFPTPDFIKKAAMQAIQHNHTRYTLNKGIIELREAIRIQLKTEQNLDYDIEEIIVSTGAKQCLFNSLLSLVSKGDEVLIPLPFWVSYPQIVKLADGLPIFLETSQQNGYKLTADILQKHITGQSKVLILCNPGNPTGSVYSRRELEELAEVIIHHKIYVISDEIYARLVYDNIPFISMAAVSEKMKAQAVIINGVSKAYAMTGWRIGYAAANKEITDAASTIQSHSTSNATTISQYASLAALTGSGAELNKMRTEFERRRDYVVSKLNAVPHLDCPRPTGAFYTFPNISYFFGRKYGKSVINDSSDLAEYLFQEGRVAVVPGSAFGAADNIRISYAASLNTLEEGMNRIGTALAKLK